MFDAWLRKTLKETGKTQRGLAKHLGLDPSIVSKMVNGDRQIKASELLPIADYFGVPPPLSGFRDSQSGVQRAKLLRVHVKKIASGGVWREAEALAILDPAIIPAVPDPRYADLPQWADRIEGIDVNKLFQIGDYAIFVPFGDVRSRPQDGDIVEVERKRGTLTEIAIRKIRIRGDATELWPESDSPQWQTPTPYPLIHNNEYLTITGLFVGMYRPAP